MTAHIPQLALCLSLLVSMGGLCFVGPAWAGPGPATPACPRFSSLVGSWDFPDSLGQAEDLRWFGDEVLLILSSRHGVVEVRLGERPQIGEVVVGADSTADSLDMPLVLATSGDQLIAGGWYHGRAHAVLWKRRGAEKIGGLDPHFAEILDLDAHEGRVAVLAPRLNPQGRILRNGALAWMGRLPPQGRKGLVGLEPVYYSGEGPKIMSFINCNIMEVGVTRFLHGGSLLVVPHVEEGVYLYDAQGELLRSWSSKQVGFDADCPLSIEEADRLALDEPGRWRWNAKRRLVDDILPLPDGRAALLIREVEDDRAGWKMAVLDPEGAVTACPLELPGGELLSSSSHLARLRVDVRGDRVAFLVGMEGAADHKLRIKPPRLLVLELE